MMYRAAFRALVTDGFFFLRLKYKPGYDHDTLADEHTLIEFSPTVRLFYRLSDTSFVFDLEGEEHTSSAVTFSAGDELTIELEHSARRRRIRLSGFTTGDGVSDAEAGNPAVVETVLFVLGPASGVPEEPATLVELRPLDAVTFAELAEQRVLAQMDREPGSAVATDQAFINFLGVLAREPARIHDTALMIEAMFNLDYAQLDLLEKIGSWLGLANEGWDVEIFRRYLKIHRDLLLSANREDGAWTGTIPNVVSITRQFIGDAVGGTVTYTVGSAYSFKLSVPTTLTAAQASLLLRFVKRAIYAGVLGFIEIQDDSDVWGSDAVAVGSVGTWGSDSVAVGGASSWGYVITTE